MARNEIACVLGAELAFQRGFEQVAGLRGDGQDQRHKDEHWGDNKSRDRHNKQCGDDAAERAAERA